jgi:hypothetical protein
MGRPLNKKYFGNRNIGTGGDQTSGDLSNSQNYADDRIGGGFLASISNGTVGAIQINNTHPAFPSLLVAAPTMPDGVTATTAVVWEIATIVLSSAGTGYTINQTGAAVTTVTGLYTQASVVPVLTINTNGTGNVSAVNITGTSRGEFTSIDGTGITTWGVVGAGGTNAQITVTFRVKSISVTQQGSGYIGTPSLSWSVVNGGTMPSAQTVTMGTDSGVVGTTDNQENSIVIRANVTGSGSTGAICDIIRQVSTRRYKVTDGTNVGVVELGTDATPADGAGYIIATDSGGATYFVTKLTAHKATLVNISGTPLFADDTAVPWDFTASTGVVSIENA